MKAETKWLIPVIVIMVIIVFGMAALYSILSGPSTPTPTGGATTVLQPEEPPAPVVNIPDNSVSTTTEPAATTTPSSTQPAADYEIIISGYAYSPNVLNIEKGEIVRWINKDAVRHDVVSRAGNELNSPLFGQDESYIHTFDEDGTYDYFCSVHPMMKTATVIVGDVGEDISSSSSSYSGGYSSGY